MMRIVTFYYLFPKNYTSDLFAFQVHGNLSFFIVTVVSPYIIIIVLFSFLFKYPSHCSQVPT
jgi:heme/copper-type cytochrome/quinol oxidase subunit 2